MKTTGSEKHETELLETRKLILLLPEYFLSERQQANSTRADF